MLARRHAASATFGCGVRESGIHALHSVGMGCRCSVASAEALATTRGRPNNRPLPLGFSEAFHAGSLRRGAGLQPAAWYGNRTRDFQSHGLVLYPLS